MIPKYIYIETTNKCNAACIMCPHDQMKRAKGVMDMELFKKIISDCEVVDLKDSTIFLHKEGEPLLDNFIFERIAFLKKKLPTLKELGLNTNGMLLNNENIIKLLNSSLDTLYVSLDGTSRETYNTIRKKLDYDIVLQNVENLFYWKKKIGSKLRIVVQMIVCDINKHEVPLFKKLWSDKADDLYIKAMHSYLDGGMTVLSDAKHVKQKSICYDPFNIIVIYHNGKCGICCWDYDNFIDIGSVENDSILDIFNNSSFEYIRKLHLEKRCSELEPCNRCLRVFGEDKICDIEQLVDSMS